MKIFNDYDFKPKKPTVITIGNFDGLHLGHQKLINLAKELAIKKNFTSIVFSFSPHPLAFFDKNNSFKTILSSNERVLEMQKLGIDIFIQYPFDLKFSNISYTDFINIIFKDLNCKLLIVGEDYCFGKNRIGNYDILKKAGQENNVEILKIDNVLFDGKRVSSSLIREYLTERNIKQVNALLNKPYYIIDKVMLGRQLGRTIGFPTANIIPKEDKLLPSDGVYITKTEYNNKVYNSITNIGKKPTFDGQNRTVETFIFDFDKNIYNETIKVMFFDWIRNEKKFDGLEELKLQITKDITKAKSFFNNYIKSVEIIKNI